MERLTPNIRRGDITMSWKQFSFGGPLLLVGALAFVTPDSAQAQHRGSGARVGNAHVGGYRGGVTSSRVYSGGVYHGGYNYGHHPGYRYGNGSWSYPLYYGYGYRSPSYYGAWPYYYGYNPYSYDAYEYGSSPPAYDSGYYGSYGDVASSYPDTTQPDTTAQVTVSLTANAELWVGGSRTTSKGSLREFHSPPLVPGSPFTYEVRARWNQNGQEVTQTQYVEVTAGTHVKVSFPK
jgi:uncharacterized protein (TIGR03000 family)